MTLRVTFLCSECKEVMASTYWGDFPICEMCNEMFKRRLFEEMNKYKEEDELWDYWGE